MEPSALPALELAGQLMLRGFAGLDLPASLAQLLERGQCAGVVLFRRNVAAGSDGLERLQALCGAVADRCPDGLPPLIAIDEEGGRVARLCPPALTMPPLRELVADGGPELVRRVASVVGRELECLGINMNLSPVVDVDTNPDNPVIGDRSASRDPDEVVRVARAYLAGLGEANVAGCLKHFPGHGDTETDSHLTLPFVRHDRARLDAVELRPFAALAAEVEAVMTAHVVFDALDPERPATLSPMVATHLLRDELGFSGLTISDDLDMQAIAARMPLSRAAPEAVLAGCDLLLCCQDPAHQDEVHAALAARIEADESFRQRASEAVGRGLALRRRHPPRSGAARDFRALMAAEIEPLQRELDALRDQSSAKGRSI